MVELNDHVAEDTDGRDFALDRRFALGVEGELLDVPFVVRDYLILTNITRHTHLLLIPLNHLPPDHDSTYRHDHHLFIC